MKTYVITTILKVSDVCKGYKPNKGMIERLLKRKEEVGVIEEDCFRGKVVMEIKDIYSDVIEV